MISSKTKVIITSFIGILNFNISLYLLKTWRGAWILIKLSPSTSFSYSKSKPSPLKLSSKIYINKNGDDEIKLDEMRVDEFF